MLLDALDFEPATVDVLVARTHLAGKSVASMLLQTRARGACGGSSPVAALPEYLEMMTGSVLDILIYVFDRYMLNETPDVPERENLARDLEHAGFAPDNVERALDWLTDLAFGHGQEQPAPVTHNGVRVFTDSELARLSTECRGLLLTLENARVLTPQQREIVILASQGLTNGEIADRLFLSPRTVASHLYRSYPKLGIAGRHQLRDLVDRAGS